MKIVVCGGHHNSALVVAEALRGKGHKIYWFGHKYSMIGDKNPSAEYLEVTEKSFPFIEIQAGKIQPRFNFFKNLIRIPTGFWQSFALLQEIKPDLIFSFGGYLALPVAYCGYLLRIPVITHEQTTVSGVANKLIAKIARRVFISFPDSADYFPKEKTVLTGLPVRSEIFKSSKKLFNNHKKTIYITGGKQGSHIINQAVFEILPRLLETFNVIHQCGSTTLFGDFEKAKKIKNENYLVQDYFFGDEIGAVFYTADFVISRAGAHTVYELMVLKKPALLIPISWSKQNEQQKNAQFLKSLGLAEILFQDDPKTLNSDKLLRAIFNFENNLEKYKINKEMPVLSNATARILQEIEKI